ncbi:hypothetical protein Q8F55_008532 [Vanrija albida]|uniref:BRCT domain-containing protein n=1 Tax=Vanrija albida TaxID=181172 RepID=A0ABR3PR31_9TREE
MARPRPQIVLPEYVNHWLDHGREPTGPDRVAWTVILKSPAVANASSAAAQPETGPSAAISAPPPPQVFAAFSPCTFYLARGCTQGLGWLIENMGGVIEDAVQSGLYVLVPGPEITGGPETQRIIDSLGPLHPSGRILDQRFVLDCFVHSSFQDFTDYTLEPSTPASPKPTIRALDTDAPTVAESRGHSPHLTAHSPPYRSEWATDVAPLNPSVHYGDTVQAVGGYCPEANIGSPPYRPSRSPSPISGLSGPGPSTMVQRKRRRNEDEHGGDDGDDGGQPMRVSMGAPAHW